MVLDLLFKSVSLGVNIANAGLRYDQNKREKLEREIRARRERLQSERAELQIEATNLMYRTIARNQNEQSKRAKNQSEKDLHSCLSFFEEGLEMLLTSLDRCEDQRSEASAELPQTDDLFRRIESLLALGPDVLTAKFDKLKSKESFAWAKSSFKSARDDGTRAFFSKELDVRDRLIAAKVRIFSAIFGCLDEPETAVTACKLYLRELNAMPFIPQLFSLHLKKINGGNITPKDELLTLVAFINYVVFRYTGEALAARNVLHENNWPRLVISETHSLHPIRSVGLRALIEKNVQESEELKCGIELVSFSQPIDATDMAVNTAGAFIVAGFDGSKNTVVYVYNDSGEFQFAVSPSEEELNENAEFHPRAVFTDEKDNIYVYSKAATKANQGLGDDASLFIFSKEGRLERLVSVENGFMALEKETGKAFISNEKGVLIYESSGELLRSFEAKAEALRGSVCSLALCDENTIIQTDIDDTNVYHLSDTGAVIRQFQVKKARGWKYLAFNPIGGEILVSYLSEDLTNFQLDAYLKNGQLLGTIDLPNFYSSHPRAVTVTTRGRIAILYENSVHLI